MSPERREAIIEALVEGEATYMLGYEGMVDPTFRDEARKEITEEQIDAYDKWLREFPA